MSNRGRNQIPRRDVGAGPLVYLLVLLAFGLVAAAVMVFSFWGLFGEPTSPEALAEWGIVQHGQDIRAVADLSDEGDLSDGCLVTEGQAVQWEDRQVVATVPLAGADVQLDGAEVTVRGAGHTAVCRFDGPAPAEAFATVARQETRQPRPEG